MTAGLQHPVFSRRTMLQAGGVSLLGLGLSDLAGLRAETAKPKSHRAVIYIFLSGGLGQHDSFDLKPDAPDSIRGEFKPIATQTPGVRICEHLPELAKRSNRWSLIRSLTHRTNNHSDAHLFMLTGRNELPPGFDASKPKETDWPSIAAVTGAVTNRRNNLPPAVVLPDRIVHNTGRVIPGQFAGMMGRQRDPWFLEASAFEPKAYGAFPAYEFDHQERAYKAQRQGFHIPDLSLPQGIDGIRLDQRLDLLKIVDGQRAKLDRESGKSPMDGYRQAAVSLLTDAKVRKAFDIRQQPAKDVERYGNNAFGWSLLMAARLVEAGVNLVQVNLGNNETWDTHGNAFPHLKDKLFPPTDKCVSALLDDLQERGLLDDTLVVMAGEFGRTPRVFGLATAYKLPGRDHWGAAQSVFIAGGGVKGGRVIGSTDKTGAFPTSDPQTPENLAATIYESLGVPKSFMWQDTQNRPHHVYHGEPIRGLT
ncbi:DUF1501 domain-containing protein [Zavarzinella formosa]|uniref:DUF1501 domain-containing protein n=1 Tax=Zavarzinella formosa TaxID=360055 RepID=UPI0004959F27|nr:DUF1501 domain-containing protein [Zavarzinella formosa]